MPNGKKIKYSFLEKWDRHHGLYFYLCLSSLTLFETKTPNLSLLRISDILWNKSGIKETE
jgi:hypothetical protein